jgi:hypothetical protein
MCEQITFYSVPGPNTSPGLIGEDIAGGWAYAIENVKFLVELNPQCQLNVVFGHVKDFGSIPIIPTFPKVNFYVYETSLTELSDLAVVEPAQQHGAILNHILSTHNLQTQFYAILDPDCYLIEKNALHHLIAHMKKSDLDMIGVSYPTTFQKVYYWDFPTAYFQLINRKNCEPSALDFLPEQTSLVAGAGMATSKNVPLVRTFRLVAKLVKRFRIPVKRIIGNLRNSRIGVLQFVYYFYSNFFYRNTPLFRDTGWRNRKMLVELKVEVIPHRVGTIAIRAGLDEDEYLMENPDVEASGVNPTWHALMHGVYEKRKMGRQRKFWELFNKLLGNGALVSRIYPATSVMMADSFLSSIEFQNGTGNFGFSYEYFWNHEPFCIHLGHGGKQNPESDLPRLRAIRSQILENSTNRNGHEDIGY